MMASKIRSAAAGTGVEVRFVPDNASLLETARASRPALLLLDLDDRLIEPIAVLAAIRSDQALASLRVLGFVSHVRADRIAAAREAGIDEVLARSAFVSKLSDLLSPGGLEP
jgi:CheY-like chemotaxis protein